MIRWLIAKRRSAGWKTLRQQCDWRTIQGRIRRAERCGDFKFVRVFMCCYLFRRKAGYENTWECIDRFSSRWAAINRAAALVQSPDGVPELPEMSVTTHDSVSVPDSRAPA